MHVSRLVLLRYVIFHITFNVKINQSTYVISISLKIDQCNFGHWAYRSWGAECFVKLGFKNWKTTKKKCFTFSWYTYFLFFKCPILCFSFRHRSFEWLSTILQCHVVVSYENLNYTTFVSRSFGNILRSSFKFLQKKANEF